MGVCLNVTRAAMGYHIHYYPHLLAFNLLVLNEMVIVLDELDWSSTSTRWATARLILSPWLQFCFNENPRCPT